jgi:hypothetical protein
MAVAVVSCDFSIHVTMPDIPIPTAIIEERLLVYVLVR